MTTVYKMSSSRNTTNARLYLEVTIKEAEKALEGGNYPFGAVVVDSTDKIIATGRNENFSVNDITAHAEMQCLRNIDIKYLLDETREYSIFCSGEPCGGCSLFIARASSIKHISWALTDPQKAGFDDLRKHEDFASFFGHIEVVEEPFEDLKEKSASLLRQYYKKLGQFEKVKLY